MTSSTFRIDAVSTAVLRWWRCRPWSGNPLMRWPDRLRAAVRLVAAVVMVASIPIALTLGTIAYTGNADRFRAENAEAVSVVAVISERPEFVQGLGWRAKARWESSTGDVEKVVPVTRTAAQGDPVTVWLDGAGNVATTPPRSSAAAVTTGIGVAVAVLVGAGVSTWCLVALSDLFVNRRRKAEWEREWSGMRRPR